MQLRTVLAIFLLCASLAAEGPDGGSGRKPAKAETSRASLVAEWVAPPQLSGNQLQGTMEVTNQSDDAFDQTVLVEAVNEIGKAFAIGYQHFNLQAHTRSVPIPFVTNLPPGHYVIHADAIAEVPSKNAIHHVSLTAPKTFDVTVI